MRHSVVEGLTPSRYRFGYLAMAISTTYLWIVLVTAILDAFGDREGPSQYMRWVPDNLGHYLTAPTSFALGRGVVLLARYLRTEHDISLMWLAHAPWFGGLMTLIAGLVQALVLYLLLRGRRLSPPSGPPRRTRRGPDPEPQAAPDPADLSAATPGRVPSQGRARRGARASSASRGAGRAGARRRDAPQSPDRQAADRRAAEREVPQGSDRGALR